VLISAFGVALGIADADRIGASAKALAAIPINKSRFMRCVPWIALIAMIANASGTRFVPLDETNIVRSRRNLRGRRAQAACVGDLTEWGLGGEGRPADLSLC
jgi:hypothetical protein